MGILVRPRLRGLYRVAFPLICALAGAVTLDAQNAPSNLTATAVSASQINLAWTDNSTDETGFEVERSLDNVTFTLITTTSANVNSYSDTGRSASTTYYYRVRARRAGAQRSAYTSVASDITFPAAPTLPAPTVVSSTQINLSWTDNSTDETGFTLERSADGGATWTALLTNTASTTFNDTGLTASTTYTYRVYAVRGADASVSNTQNARTAPAPPTLNTATAVSSSQIDLSWTDNSSDETGFTVERSADGGATWATILTNMAVTTFSDTGRTAGTAYSYRVYAIRGSVSSEGSNVLAATTLAAPAAPALTATTTNFSSSAIDLSWTDPNTYETGYRIERFNISTSTWEVVTTTAANATSFQDTGLSASTSYDYRAFAIDGPNASPASNTATAKTGPAAPTLQTPAVLSSTEITLTWTDNSSDETGFTLQRSADGGSTWTTILTDTAVTNFADSGLSASTPYVYRVYAFRNTDGISSPASNTQTATTGPAAPTLAAPTVVSSSQINLSWTDNSSDETGFTLQRSADGGTTWTTILTNTAVTTFNDTGLTAATPYTYRVYAMRGTIPSTPSNTQAATTLAAPTAPTLAAAPTPFSSTSIDLTWNDPNAYETGYRIERFNTSTSSWDVVTTTAANATSFSDTGRSPSTSYDYRVFAIDGPNDSAASNTATATTAPAAPTLQTPTVLSSTEITLNWTDNSSDETGFTLQRSADGGTSWTTILTNAAVTTYNDSGLTASTPYTYRVYAVRGSVHSTASNTQSTTTGPAAPTLAAPTVVSSSQINLSWTDNSSDETGFTVQRSADGGTSWTTILTNAAVTSFNDTGRTASTAYTYRVYAMRGTVPSTASNTQTATTLAPPPAPTLAAVPTPFSSTSIDLSWNDTSIYETGYRIERFNTSTSSWDVVTTTAANVTTFTDTGRTASTSYDYRVFAIDGPNASTASNTATAITAPAAPTLDPLTVVSSTQIDLSWTDNSTDETGFTVQRSTDGGTTWTTILTNAAVTVYSDTGLTADTTYTYRVYAVRGSVHSTASNTRSATTSPNGPTNLVATAISSSRITLTWIDNSSNETGFTIQRSPDNSTWTSIASVAADATTFSDTLLSANTLYYYRVFATSATGDSPFSNVDSDTTFPIEAAVAGLTATTTSSTTIDLVWTDNTYETGYRIERATSSGGPWTALTPNNAANDVTFTNTGLTADTTYYYRIIALDGTNESAPSNVASATTGPVAPTALSALAVSATQIDLAWTDNSSNETGFTIQRSPDGTTWTTIATGVAGPTYSDSTVSASTLYFYRVIAVNANGPSTPSNTASDTTFPAAPTLTSVTAVSSQRIDLVFTDNSPDETSFTIERSTDNLNWTTAGTNGANDGTFTDTGLTASTLYYYRVRATSPHGTSAYSNVMSTTTLAPPAAPTLNTATAVSSSRVDLAWTDNSTYETGFRVEYSLDGTTWTTAGTTAANATTFAVTGLTASTLYQFRVTALDGPNTGAPSNIRSATTLVPPNAPSGLTATAVSATQIDLTWTDNSTYETGFRIELSTDGLTWTTAGTNVANDVTFSATGLIPGTTYYFRVYAVDGPNESAASNGASATTPQIPPAAPSYLIATAVSATSIVLNWTDNSNNESGFIVQRLIGSTWTTIGTTAANVKTYTDTGLVANTHYRYRVMATNSAGTSSASTEAIEKTLSCTAALCAEPITWNVMGLDSNNVNVGPNQFMAGARVCNTTGSAITNVNINWVWDSAEATINTYGNTSLIQPVLAANTCNDFYFNIEITRTAAAYLKSRDYHIAVTADGGLTASTPLGREIYVEQILEQNRNTAIAIDGPTETVVGETYQFTLYTDTAPQGYEQLTTGINFPNDIFHIVSMHSTYTNPSGSANNDPYSDACGWQPDPGLPNYLSCVGPCNYPGCRAGGAITQTYTVQILGETSGTTLCGFILDFSGSSYHYNSNYGANCTTVTAVQPPTALTMRDAVAEKRGSAVSIAWRVEKESGNIGFNVYREENGQRTLVNPGLIAGSSLLIGSASLRAGSSYVWHDPDAGNATAYWIESMDIGGTTEWHGPIRPVRTDTGFPPATPSLMIHERFLEQAEGPHSVTLTAEPAPHEPDGFFMDARVGSDAAPNAATAHQFMLAASPTAKIRVKNTGMVRVTQAQLAAAGFVAGNPRNLQLFREGVEVPVSISGEADGSFDAADSITFYGQALDTPVTDTRVYWLLAGNERGKRMEPASIGNVPPLSDSSFLHTVTRVENRTYFPMLANGDEDSYFGTAICSTCPAANIPFTLTHVDTSPPASASLEVSLLGSVDSRNIDPDHEVEIKVNGIAVGSMTFSALSIGKATFTFPQVLLNEGANTIKLSSLVAPSNVSAVDYLKLSYWHTYAADANRLAFTAPGQSAVTITGFTATPVRVFDITDPATPLEITASTVASGGGHEAQVNVPGRGVRRLIAVTDATFVAPSAVTLNSPSTLNKKNNAGQWMLIGHPSLLPTAAPLANLRSGEGYSTAVIDIEDVYDEFNFGAKSPKAIKDFLQYARNEWKTSPSFVTLLGDSTFDPRNYMNFGDFDLLPTKLVDTEFGKTASEDWFSDFDGDGIADIALGRIPVRTAADASVVIGKIVGYHSASGGAWTKNALLLSDRDDLEGNDFPRANDDIAALLPSGVNTHKTYLDVLGTAAATRADLFDQLNNVGQVYLNFLGHGSLRNWSQSNLMTSNDAVNLKNGAKLPFTVALTCLSGQFQDVFDVFFGPTMAEALLRAPNGGAVAVWGSSGLTFMFGQEPANQELTRQLFPTSSSSLTTLGEAVRRAKLATTDPDVRKTWILFGDPATRLKYQP